MNPQNEKQEERCTIIVNDLLVDVSANPPCSAVDEDFLRILFQDHHVSSSPDAVIIKVEISQTKKPYSYAFIKFDTLKNAIEAINELNYTKLDNVPIRLILADKETQDIIHSNIGNLYIENLDPDIEVSQLHEAFANFGEIISCKIPTDLVITASGEQKYVSRGYGYVQFRNPEDAIQTMEYLKDTSINGRPLKITTVSSMPNTETNFKTIYIINFPKHFKDSDLIKLFEEYGTPVNCNIMVDEKRECKRLCFCTMSTHHEAVLAIEGLNCRVIVGYSLFCGVP